MPKTKASFIFIVVYWLICFGHVQAQRIVSAHISDPRSNQLEVKFSENIQLSNADGFRLTGGAARIIGLRSGSGSSKLIFQLSDHVLPSDQFELLHWQELSDATANNQPLPTLEDIQVDNQVRTYQGKGNVYYVSSSSGSDRADGKSPDTPFKTFNKAVKLIRPSDYLLLKRGDKFRQFTIENLQGKKSAYLTIGAYGRGARPKVHVGGGRGIKIENSSFIILDNLHVIKNGRGNAITIMGNTSHPVLSNLLVEGKRVMAHYGINFGRNDGRSSKVINPQIINSTVKNFRWNIRSSGFPYDGTHEIIGGLIENNISAGNFRDPDSRDGISAQRGNFHGLIVRKNEVYGWVDDAMDFFAAENVIVEYNDIHDPMSLALTSRQSGGGNGIKAGGRTNLDIRNGKKSQNIIVRYNQVYNLRNDKNRKARSYGITTNRGGSGKIYGNLIYRVDGDGIAVFGAPESWQINNNTVFDSNFGLNIYIKGGNPSKINVSNNIFFGRKRGLKVNTNGNGNVKGSNNVLIGKAAFGNYIGNQDILSQKDQIFKNTTDFELRTNSPAINHGKSFTDYQQDIRGLAIRGKTDAGAIESGSQSVPDNKPLPEDTQPEVEENEPNAASDPNGLRYRYYEGRWKKLPNFSAEKVIKEGIVKKLDLSERGRKDLFAFVFESFLEINRKDTYTFYTRSNDGSKLFIDDQMIVDNDGLHGARERSGSIHLEPGRYPIRVTFFERGRKESLEVFYKSSTMRKRPISDNKFFLNDDPGEGIATKADAEEQAVSVPQSTDNTYSPGIRFKYYEGKWRFLPDFEKLSAIKEGVVDNFELKERNRNDRFAFLYEGYILIDKNANYTFSTISDDGSQLFIGNTKVVDNDGLHGPRKRSGKIFLEKGYHPIRLGYFERGGGETLRVRFSSNGRREQPIPSSILFHKKGDLNKRKILALKNAELVSAETTINSDEKLLSQAEKTILAYPNPFDQHIQLYLDGLHDDIQIRIFDAGGMLIEEFEIAQKGAGKFIDLELTHLKSGIYFLNMFYQNDQIHSLKIIKK